MRYSHFYFYYLSCVFLSGSLFSSSGTHVKSTLYSEMSVKTTTGGLDLTTDRVSTGADTTTHTLHSAANSTLTHQQNLVPHQRNHTSNQTTMNITDPARQITTRAQWHAWFDSRRAILRARLKQAEEAEWNWPSTRARCEVMRIEDEIRELDAEEFVVPF